MTVWYKQGVTGDLQAVTRKGLGRIADLIASCGHDTYITSLREGNHMSGSLHYEGLAFDFVHYSRLKTSDFKEVLGPDWDIVDETDHIHCEYDPKIV